MKEKFCLFCGALLPQSAKFCSSCGEQQEEVTERVSVVASTEAVEAELVMTAPAVEEKPAVESAPVAVAVPQLVAEMPAPDAERAEPAPVKRKRNFGWIQSALLLLLATVMLAMAFLPIAKLDMETYEDDFKGMELGLGSLNLIGFAFDSFRNLDDEELADSSVFEKLEEMAADFEESTKGEDVDTYNDLSSSDQRLLDKFMLLMMRLAYQSEDANCGAVFYVMAVFVLLYLMLCATFFVLALLNLLSSLRLLPFGKKLARVTVSIFCAVPMLLLVLYYTVFATYDAHTPISMGAPVKITLILAGVGVVAMAIIRFFKTPRCERKVSVLRIVSVCFAILLVCMPFVPVMSAHVKTVFYQRERERELKIPMNVAFFDRLKGDMEEDYYYYDFFEAASREEAKTQVASFFDRFSWYTEKEIKQGCANSVNGDIVIGSLAAGKMLPICGFFAHTCLFYLLVMMGAALLLWQNLCYFTGGKTAKGCVLAGKITFMIGAALSLVVVVALALILHLCVDKYAPDGYRVFFTAGSVLTLVTAIAACACPVGKKK